MAGNRQRDGFFDKPWAAIAAAAGVLIVVAGAIVFFTSGFGNLSGLPSPGTAADASPAGPGVPAHTAASPGTPGVLSYNVARTSGHEPGDIAVPDKGVFIRVVSRGGYSGTWTSGNETGEVRNSGERLVAIENPGNTVSADLWKLDNSARQSLTLEIWKDGTRRTANSTSHPFGRVTASATLQEAEQDGTQSVRFNAHTGQ
ncbi:MAG: hypothetical protein PHT99_09505 [Methanoregula sp.]|nr:hypothetical protein [Methanoregula sp.]